MIDNPFMLHEFLLQNAVSLDYLRSKDDQLTMEITDIIRAFKLQYKIIEDVIYKRKPETLHEVITLIDRQYLAEFKVAIENAVDVRSEQYHLEYLFNSIRNVSELSSNSHELLYIEMSKFDLVTSMVDRLPQLLWLKFNIEDKEIGMYKIYINCLVKDLQRDGLNWDNIGY